MTQRYAAQLSDQRDASPAEIERTLQRDGADAVLYGWQPGGRAHRLPLTRPIISDPRADATPR